MFKDNLSLLYFLHAMHIVFVVTGLCVSFLSDSLSYSIFGAILIASNTYGMFKSHDAIFIEMKKKLDEESEDN